MALGGLAAHVLRAFRWRPYLALILENLNFTEFVRMRRQRPFAPRSLRSRACATQIFSAFIGFSGCHALTQKAFFVSYLNKKPFWQKNLLVGVTS